MLVSSNLMTAPTFRKMSFASDSRLARLGKSTLIETLMLNNPVSYTATKNPTLLWRKLIEYVTRIERLHKSIQTETVTSCAATTFESSYQEMKLSNLANSHEDEDFLFPKINKNVESKW